MTNNTPDYEDNLFFKEKKMNDIKYTPEDIDRIFEERVDYTTRKAELKRGLIMEWAFKYPNGKRCAFIEASFPVNPTNFSVSIGEQVCISKIKNKLWEICGQYSIITGEKL